MDNEENFTLCWTEFESSVRATWQQLQIDKEFCDVTLVCNDGQIQSHRIILSNISPVLKDILKQNSNENPVIYLRGVKYKYLQSLVNFMYQGEVTVSNEDLENVLDLSRYLKVSGLSQENGETKFENFPNNDDSNYFSGDNTKGNNLNRESHTESNHENVERNTDNSEFNRERRPESKHGDIGPSSKEKRAVISNQTTNIIENRSIGILAEFENFLNNVDSNSLIQDPKTLNLDMAEDLKVPRLLTENEEKVTPCDQLLENVDKVLIINQNEELHESVDEDQVQQNSVEKSIQRKHIKQTFTSNESNAVVNDNSLCLENDSSRKMKFENLEPDLNKEVSHLSHDKYSTQKIVSDRLFTCDKCDKQYTKPIHLRKHKASVHEGVRYPCNESNSVVNDNSLSLENDSSRKIKLENLEPDCNKEVSHLSNDKHNTQKIISDRWFSCDKCDKQFTKPTHLRTHKASVHEGVRYPCNECNAGPFSDSRSLRTHKSSAHEGVRYHCDQCNAGPFTQIVTLRTHKASAHEGVRYPCDECNAGPFTQAGHLRTHKASVHEGVRYECISCDYRAKTKGSLKRHCIRIHKF